MQQKWVKYITIKFSIRLITFNELYNELLRTKSSEFKLNTFPDEVKKGFNSFDNNLIKMSLLFNEKFNFKIN
jgi:hypothetical protein